MIIRARLWPDVALHRLGGMFLPPHQRIMLYVANLMAATNVIIGSRGTSKSATMAVLFATHRALFYSKRKLVTLSSTGWRGGQLLFEDFDKMVSGDWYNQTSGLEFLRKSLGERIIWRAASYWRIDWESGSSNLTVPTNDPQKIRGIRGTDLLIDEANFFDNPELVNTVADSFLNVLGDFKSGGQNAQQNSVYYMTTVDYGWREFQKTAISAKESVAQDYEVWQAVKRGDADEVKRLTRRKLLRATYLCIDYTDTIIWKEITTRDGKVMRVKWPNKEIKFQHDSLGVPYTVMGEEYRLMQQGQAADILTTYPINREIEDKVLDGVTSEASWLAEQRNVVDMSSGDVYPHILVDEVSFRGSRSLLQPQQCGADWISKYPDRDYSPTIMQSCSDPCVVGVDYAPGSRDFSAYVVMRVGPLAEGNFSPLTGHGKTPWSNVIWTEQHRLTSHKDVAEKIREFALRYNLIYDIDPLAEEDPDLACRAIGLDMRGGGSGVRDELVHINKDSLGPGEYRIYDPMDKDPRVKELLGKDRAIPMLDAILPSDSLNDRLVEFTLGQMQQKLLFLPKDIPIQDRPLDKRVDVAYEAAKVLHYQLTALQQKPTKNFRTFYMANAERTPGGGKKDLWAAFIYAAKQLRAHLLKQRLTEDTHAPFGAVVTTARRRRGY